MTPDRCLDVLTMLSAALHSRGEEKDRHITRAMDALRPHAAQVAATGRCVRDSTACVPECTIARGLYGRCGRDAR
jgi:hypothetical protein